MNDQLIISIKEGLQENTDKRRYKHTLGVVEAAMHLAEKYGENVAKAELAALMHDFAKCFDQQRLMEYINTYSIKLDNIMLEAYELLHGEVAAIIGKEAFNICDEDVLNAIRYHTTGRANMSKLEKIIYLSDFIENGRDYPGVEELRKIAYKDLDKGVLQALDNTMIYVIKIKQPLHPNTLAARNEMLLKIHP